MPKLTKEKGSKEPSKHMEYSLEELDRDLINFQNLCNDLKIDKSNQLEIMKPLTSKIPKTHTFYCLVLLSVLICLSIILLGQDSISWHLTAIVRIAMIKMLPYLDWRYLEYEQCLIPKQHQNYNIQQEIFQCSLCESFKDFEDFLIIDKEINPDVIEELMAVHKPIILAGEIDHWIKESPEQFIEQLINHQQFSKSFPCNLKSNIYDTIRDDVDFETLIKKRQIHDGSFFMHFRNCRKDAVRIFRNYTHRPWFLPENVAPVTFNWLIWNKNYQVMNYKQLELFEKCSVIGQMFGKTRLRLLPKGNCHSTCLTLEGVLPARFMMVLTNLWDVEYLPEGISDNMAAILEIR
ncbi:hypothetical protein ABEB36_007030 [Hypothenemus hampei]|uniref:Uncharacterized protein n=1 Tax=Hypothenemus hampei TaxID=57062 RepID=A0ABD1ESJ7_HYPHA